MKKTWKCTKSSCRFDNLGESGKIIIEKAQRVKKESESNAVHEQMLKLNGAEEPQFKFIQDIRNNCSLHVIMSHENVQIQKSCLWVKHAADVFGT